MAALYKDAEGIIRRIVETVEVTEEKLVKEIDDVQAHAEELKQELSNFKQLTGESQVAEPAKQEQTTNEPATAVPAATNEPATNSVANPSENQVAAQAPVNNATQPEAQSQPVEVPVVATTAAPVAQTPPTAENPAIAQPVFPAQ